MFAAAPHPTSPLSFENLSMRISLPQALGLMLGIVSCLPVLADQTESSSDRLERAALMVRQPERTALTDIQHVGQGLVMVGENGRILLRSAEGQVRQAEVPVDLLLTAVHFVDARQGWAVGHDGVVLHSSDGGQTWSKQLDGKTINALMLDWAKGEVARLQAANAEAPGDEHLKAALDDASFALDDVKAGAEAGASRPLLDVWFRDAEQGWVVGAYGMILHTSDGGRTWAFMPGLDNPDRLHLNAVLGLPDGNILVAGEGGRLYRRVGEQWQPAQQLTQSSLYHFMRLRDGSLLVMGFGGALFASHDQGASWQSLAAPVKSSLYGGEQLADGGILLTGQAGVLLYAKDGHNFHTWQGAGRAPWLAAAQLDGGDLALVGSAGLRTVSRTTLEEAAQ